MAFELKPQNGNQFFDVLIDQIVNDVRQEFQQLTDSKPNTAVIGGSPRPSDDLVSRLIDFRARQSNIVRPAALKSISGTSSVANRDSKVHALAAMMGQVLAGGDSIAKSPGFKDAEAEVAFQIVARYGARFFTSDFKLGGILPDALKRERRRVLLSLHPDRQPEAERSKAHERFLAASDAFTQLADRAMASIDDEAA
jgi:hypothetical protein